MEKDDRSSNSVIAKVSEYISRSGEADLPEEVITKAKHHILDTLAAMVSGSTLKPGQLAKEYVRSQGGVQEAQVVGSQIVTSAINAALANGMMAHADETDDFNARSQMHPGVAIVPAALAIAERAGADGLRFLKAVVVGYDIGCRITRALGANELRQASRCTNSIGGNFGAATAAAALLRLEGDQVRHVLSYAGEQASGVLYWMRDEEHILKAFVFGGMPARNGVTAAIFVQSGFTGVLDPLSGEHNFLKAYSPIPNPRPELLAEGLGSSYEIMFSNIKKFSVGSPIVAPLDALVLLIEKYGLTSKDVQSVTVSTYEEGARVVNDRDMPDINLQHLFAVTLVDGDLTFETSHSYKRMEDPEVLEVKKRITLVGKRELSTAGSPRQGIVEVITKDGTRLKEHVISPRGMMENPMTTGEIEKKCVDLLTSVLGKDRSRALIERIWNLEQVRDLRELRPLLSA